MKIHILLSYHGQRIYGLFSAISHLDTSVFLQEQRPATRHRKVYVCSLICCCLAEVQLLFLFKSGISSDPFSPCWEKAVRTSKNWKGLQEPVASLATFSRNDVDIEHRDSKPCEPLGLGVTSGCFWHFEFWICCLLLMQLFITATFLSSSSIPPKSCPNLATIGSLAVSQ